MTQSKEYFQSYYQAHKEEYKKRNERLQPAKKKAIKSKYYKKHHKKLIKYAKECYRKKTERPDISRVLGVRIKEKDIKPFKKRISPELLAKMEENTRINNEKIKFFTLEDTKENILARNIMRNLIKIKKGG